MNFGTDYDFVALPFLKDPNRFLSSYHWSCQVGHELSSRARHQITEFARCETGDASWRRSKSAESLESLLNCYAHVRVCRFCIPVEQANRTEAGIASRAWNMEIARSQKAN